MIRHSCRFVEVVFGLIIIVAAFVNYPVYSKWIVVVAAILLVLHGVTCSICGISVPEEFLEHKRRKR